MAKKRSAFGEAFAKARREQGADGTFTYKGKKYNTRRADDPPADKKLRTAPVPKPRPRSQPTITPKTIAAMTADRVEPARGSSRPVAKPRSQPTITPGAIAAMTADRAEPTRGSSEPRKDPAAAGIKGIRSGKTPREALADKMHSSPSKDASGKGPGSTRHPGMGLRGATIRKAVEDSAKSNPADARRTAMPMDNEEEVAFRDDDLPKKSLSKRRKKSPTTMLDVVGGLSKGGMLKYNKGGKIRGYGMAKGGRPCKMVTMKGS